MLSWHCLVDFVFTISSCLIFHTESDGTKKFRTHHNLLTGILKWRVKFVAWLGCWAPILWIQVKRGKVRFQVMITANKVNLWFDSWSKPNSRNWNFRKFQILCVILKGWVWKIMIRLNCRIYGECLFGKKFLFVSRYRKEPIFRAVHIYDAKYTLSQI